MLHWPAGAGGKGALLTRDTIQVVLDRRFAGFMRSYPNLIRLEPGAIQHLLATITPFRYDRVYRGWWGRIIASDAPRAVRVAADRYVRWSSGS